MMNELFNRNIFITPDNVLIPIDKESIISIMTVLTTNILAIYTFGWAIYNMIGLFIISLINNENMTFVCILIAGGLLLIFTIALKETANIIEYNINKLKNKISEQETIIEKLEEELKQKDKIIETQKFSKSKSNVRMSQDISNNHLCFY